MALSAIDVYMMISHSYLVLFYSQVDLFKNQDTRKYLFYKISWHVTTWLNLLMTFKKYWFALWYVQRCHGDQSTQVITDRVRFVHKLLHRLAPLSYCDQTLSIISISCNSRSQQQSTLYTTPAGIRAGHQSRSARPPG